MLSGLAPDRTHAQPAPPPAPGDTSFREFLPPFEQALTRFVNDDPAAWKRLASRRADATIMGTWGAYERGGAAVQARYDWAAARFREGGATVRSGTSPPRSAATSPSRWPPTGAGCAWRTAAPRERRAGSRLRCTRCTSSAAASQASRPRPASMSPSNWTAVDPVARPARDALWRLAARDAAAEASAAGDPAR